MASSFPTYVAQGFEPATWEEEFKPDSGLVTAPGDFVYYDTSSQTVKLCGADPTLIAGICEFTYPLLKGQITANNKLPIRLLQPERATLAFSSTTTPAETHVGVRYGITQASAGIWQIDTSKTTTAARVLITRVDIPNGIFYGIMLATNLQFANIAHA